MRDVSSLRDNPRGTDSIGSRLRLRKRGGGKGRGEHFSSQRSARTAMVGKPEEFPAVVNIDSRGTSRSLAIFERGQARGAAKGG